MPSIVSAKTARRWLRQRGGLVATLAALAAATAACGSTGTSSGPSTAASPSTSASSASPAASGTAAGGVTATGITLPAGQPGKGKPAFTIGDKNFSEEYILGDLYEQALKDKGYTVTLKSNIGGSEVIDRAFQSGEVQLYPEYTGEIVSTIAHEKLPGTAAATYQGANAFEQAHRGAALLRQTPFQDTNVVVVKKTFATKYHLTTTASLANVGPHGKGVTIGGPPADRTRYEGLVGMQQAYGLTGLTYKGFTIGTYYTALNQGSINAALADSTDGQLTTGTYTVLKDPKHIFGFQYVAPVVKTSLLSKEGPAFAQTLNWVDSLLTVQAVRVMNAAVQLNHADPATVAEKFLAANGLT